MRQFKRPMMSVPHDDLGEGKPDTWSRSAGYILGSKFDEVDRYLGPASSGIMTAVLIGYGYRVATFKIIDEA